jgi:hypothetical protein
MTQPYFYSCIYASNQRRFWRYLKRAFSSSSKIATKFLLRRKMTLSNIDIGLSRYLEREFEGDLSTLSSRVLLSSLYLSWVTDSSSRTKVMWGLFSLNSFRALLLSNIEL